MALTVVRGQELGPGYVSWKKLDGFHQITGSETSLNKIHDQG